MDLTEKLDVWYESDLVGHIWRDTSGFMSFQYHETWISHGFPVSQQLPLNTSLYTGKDKRAHKFFANLLPEEGARNHIVRQLKIPNTDYDLLKKLGGECAGALSILLSGDEPIRNHQYQKISNASLEKIVSLKENIFSKFSADKRPRLSLAGAQDKCPIYVDNGQFYLPEGASPSTHIMKFEIPHYRHVPAYECFLTWLAKTVGLPVVNIDFQSIGKKKFLLVERFDRIRQTDGTIRRLHQEDFCQALGFGYDQKYQSEGGPSFVDCFKLVQNISQTSIIDVDNLIKWQVFNFLAGNADGHAKNLALLYDNKNGVSLAPFYDLVCTKAIEGIDHRLAFSIGNQFEPGNTHQKHWDEMAEACNIKQTYLKKSIIEMAQALVQNIDHVRAAFQTKYGEYTALNRVTQVIMRQCRKTLKQLG